MMRRDGRSAGTQHCAEVSHGVYSLNEDIMSWTERE
jgi:hypothetical protein